MYTEEKVREIIDKLIDEDEKKLGYHFKVGAIESINEDYNNHQFGTITSAEDYINECLYEYIVINDESKK